MDWDPNASDSDGYICPPCPVFYPTAEEFQHPLKFISSIRHIGMQAGICKIVPPKGWRPPFAINEKTFRFRTRVQQLNCIEGHSRAEGQFVEALRLFLYQRGQPMKELPRADGQLVNLRLLYKTVVSLDGFEAVCANGRWEQVVRRVGRTKAASEPSEELCSTYKAHYEATLLAYERDQHSKENSDTKETKVKIEQVQATPSGASASGDTKATPSSRPRTLSGRKRSFPTTRDEDDTEEEGVRVKRTLFSEGEHTSSEENDGHSTTPPKPGKPQMDQKLRLRQRDLEPESLKPSQTRNVRLGAPEIQAGQKFYRFFPGSGAILAEVKRVFGGKKPHVAVRYVEDGSNDDVEMSTMEILIANGWDANAAELAYNSEICQVCLRGDCWDRMLLCDGCNSGQHLFCLDKPLAEVPSGDWYCKECVEDADNSKANPKFGFDMGAEISMLNYKERADAWKRNYFSLPPDANPDTAISDRDLEREYWRLLSIPMHEQRLEVQYGSDVDTGANGSGFPRLDLKMKTLRSVTKRWKNLTGKAKSDYVRQLSEFFSHGLREGLSAAAGGDNHSPDAAKSLEELLQRYAQDDWNLNNMPKLPGSVLQHLDEDIKGVMVPWLYAGMCFSTFCWHVEDHNFYSTSYLHSGAPKTWYGIPCASAELMERTMKELTPELFGSQPDLHMQLVTMFSPKTLREHGVPVYRATHRPNEFIVTFPSAYHAGFNNGFNCAEAVNFATVDWLPWGAKSLRKYREFHKLPVFCHEALVCTLAETLVDGSDFDFEHTESFLLPAVEQLLQDYREFQRRVDDSNSEMHVAKREVMADFEKHQHRALVGAADPEASSTSLARRNMVARTCNKPSTSQSSSSARGVRGASKMKMEMSKPSMRPTRMVLWAGRSGKDEGLRCVTCKQYCYLQAVVCTRCRPPHGSNGGPTVGCLEHYPTMCKCGDPENFVYLYRHEAARLEEMLTNIRNRLNGVRAWNKECDDVVRCTREPGAQPPAAKPTVLDLKRLLARGKSCGGADRERLDTLELSIAGAGHWDARANQLLRALEGKQTQGLSLSIDEFESMLGDAEKLVIEPAAVGKVREVVVEWRATRTSATDMLKSTEVILLDKFTDRAQLRLTSADASSFIPSMGAPNVLLHENVRFGQLSTAITGVQERLRARKESAFGGSLLSQLAGAQRYLEVLCKVNILAASIVERSRGSTAMGAPTQAHAERVLTEVDELQLGDSRGITNAEILRKLLIATQAEALEVDEALHDHSKSTEELEVLLRRARAFPIPPTNTQELEDRLEKCQMWERRAHQILNTVSGSGTSTSYKSMVERPSLEDVEIFYAQADAHFVSSSSLLRRQVHSRVQDCRRWYDAVHALFLRPSNGHVPLGQFLQSALDKVQQQHLPSGDQAMQLHSRLHCVCQQVLSERAQLVTCQRCQRYFHPQCVPELMPQQAKDAFLCASCRPPHRKRAGHGTTAHASPQIFCVCRGVDQTPMICCDFCDEWYHAACVDLSPRELDGIEAFRCPRCSRRQNLYYLDKKLLRRECMGRRPTLARVESFLNQMQTQLVACPPGAHELLAYIHAVKGVESDVNAFVHNFALQEFSPAVYATPDYAKTQEAAVLRLMERVTNLEVGLETAQTQLGAMHWCLRACHLVLGPHTQAPRYSHLAALLQDVRSQEPGFVFPREEYRLMQLTIAERVSKAAQWLRATKTLEVEEWNVEKARRLQRESEELGAYLELPATELQLVQGIVASHETVVSTGPGSDEEEEEETYAEQPESPSTIAWKMQRRR
ncbi:Lysine-specific demethylase 5C [Phytophthora ramorum]|nr:Lysine-specific demethylase 5C [Phytophthora ramorum]